MQDDTLAASVPTLNEAALLFTELDEYDDMARSAMNPEFYEVWAEADDLSRAPGDEMATREQP